MPRRPRNNSPRANAMIFADASVCLKTGAAGWGAWVKRDGGVSQVFGGSFRNTMVFSTEAELAAIANAIHRALAWRLIIAGDVVMVQSDSAEALARIRQFTAAGDNPAVGGLRVGPSRRPPRRPLVREAVERIKVLAEQHRLTLVVRHVRGHQAGPGRQWVNAECDRTAKDHMRARRAEMAPATDHHAHEARV